MSKKPVIVPDESTLKWAELDNIQRLEQTDLDSVNRVVALSRAGIDESLHIINGMFNPGFDTKHTPLKCTLLNMESTSSCFNLIFSAANAMTNEKIRNKDRLCCLVDFETQVIKFATDTKKCNIHYVFGYTCRKHMYIMRSMVDIQVVCKIEFAPREFDKKNYEDDSDNIFGIIYRLATPIAGEESSEGEDL